MALEFLTRGVLDLREKIRVNSRDTSTKKEIDFLRLRVSGTPSRQGTQRAILQSITEGTAERAGVDASKKFQSGELGLLERESGRTKSGTDFYFQRVLRVKGNVYYLDALFDLDHQTKQYAYQEN